MARGKRSSGVLAHQRHKNHRLFHQSLLRRYGGLAIILTAFFILTEISSPITPVLLANMAASILGVGIILAMILTASKMRKTIQEQTV